MSVSVLRRLDRWIPCGFRNAGFGMTGATCETAVRTVMDHWESGVAREGGTSLLKVQSELAAGGWVFR